MGKKLCEKEKVKKNFTVIRYECKKCGQVSEKEKHLCKPKKVKS